MRQHRAAVLGVAQGVAEVVPVSSSAQLVLLPWLLGWEQPADRTTFAAALHAGSCLGIAWALREDLRRLSVRDGVVFLASALQPAGYTLGRGDAEAIEADVPFTKGQLRGLFKMIAEQPCSTQWILALQSATAPAAGATTAPLLPPVTSTSPSPLPFG